MDAEGIREVFADVMAVRIRRMFGGHGVFDGDTMFALEVGGEIYLKTDAQTQGRFAEAGCAPFTYRKQGRDQAIGYWSLPAEAFDDPSALRLWTGLAVETARRQRMEKPLRRRAPAPPARPR